MEGLSQVLMPYKDLVGQVASLVTIGQFFSGVFICKDIYQKKSTQGISSLAFIGGIAIGILMLEYGLILSDPAILQVNVVAIALNAIYILFYYQYSQDKYEEVLKPIGYSVALVAVLLGYSQVESPENLEFRYGMIVTVLLLALIGSPLAGLKEILAKKDASSIPFPMTFMASIVSFLWFLYGVILNNYFMIVQNIIGFALASVQLVLIFLYPGQSSEQNQGPSKKKKPVKKD